MYINYFFCFIFYKYQTIPNSLCYLYCQSNKFYCFAFQKNMVHGEARAECSCFNFFPFRFLHLRHFLFFSVLLYSLSYLIGSPPIFYLFITYSFTTHVYILSESLSVEIAVVVVLVFLGVAVPLYVPVSLSNVIFTL